MKFDIVENEITRNNLNIRQMHLLGNENLDIIIKNLLDLRKVGIDCYVIYKNLLLNNININNKMELYSQFAKANLFKQNEDKEHFIEINGKKVFLAYVNKENKFKLINPKENKELNKLNNSTLENTNLNMNNKSDLLSKYSSYRNKLISYYKEKKVDDMMYNSRFVLSPDGKTIDHYLEKITTSGRMVVEHETFPYDETFKKEMLQPACNDFAKISPSMSNDVRESTQVKFKYNYTNMSENSNALQIENMKYEELVPIYREMNQQQQEFDKEKDYSDEISKEKGQQLVKVMNDNRQAGKISPLVIILSIVIIACIIFILISKNII